MATEAGERAIPFTDIHINLQEQTITLKKEKETVATLVFAGKLPAAGVIFLPGSKDVLPEDVEELFREADPDGIGAEEADSLPRTSEPVSPAPPNKEKEKTMTLTGKLKSIPKPGRTDR